MKKTVPLGRYKKWLVGASGLLIFLLAIAAGFNWYMDPLWCFSTINRFNRFSPAIDSRQQKTNKITFGKGDYDTLIIGSSRTEHLKADDFTGCHAFNYAAPSMYPEEYEPYIDYFRKHNGNLHTIVIGLDFYGTNKIGTDKSRDPSTYLSESNSLFYRPKVLLSKDSLRFSINTLKHEFDNCFYYDKNTADKFMMPLAKPVIEQLRNDQLMKFKQTQLGKGYEYNADLLALYRRLVNENKNCRIVAFTTPVARPYFELIVREGALKDYLRWIRETVEAFGAVYNFMYLNSVTNNLDNYLDLHHFYPRVGTLIIHRITNRRDEQLPADFGVLVTKENLEEHLQMLRDQASSIIGNGAIQGRPGQYTVERYHE